MPPWLDSALLSASLRGEIIPRGSQASRLNKFRGAFSLIEFLAVLALMALLAGTAALSLRSAGQKSAMDRAAAQLVHADRAARQSARRNGHGADLRFDLDQHTFAVATEANPAELLLRLDGVAIEQVRVAGRSVGQGQLAILCSSRGQTPSYALALRDAQQQRRWLLVAGLTGTVETLDDEKQVKTILGLCGSASHDAD